MEAARRQFAAHGYSGTSNRAIAEAAGLTHTAIYNHFSSKAGLFTAVFTDVHDRLLAELQRSEAAHREGPAMPGALLDAIEALRATDETYVDFLSGMYVEVRRHPELQVVFRQGTRFGVFDQIRRLAGVPGDRSVPDDATWFWIVFAIGLAQVSTLADDATFDRTVTAFRDGFSRFASGGT